MTHIPSDPSPSAERFVALFDSLGLPAIVFGGLGGLRALTGSRIGQVLSSRQRVALIEAVRAARARPGGRAVGPVVFDHADWRVSTQEVALDERDPLVIAVLEPRAGRAAWGSTLTPRQREVAQLVAKGTGLRDAAEKLGISEHTARHHLEAAYARLGVSNRAELARRMHHGAVDVRVD
ncbi:MAG: LuxR C-terminal-related transcriptional regulator [Gemmatimonadaceae bacterium]|nr:LuxR C-terminal-related transcriptional regulator [Gemmatimonadaceae bacterium]